MKTIKDINLKNKTVLVRTGFDVPIKDGKVVDNYRIVAGLSTIKYLLKQNCKIILIFHIGRPKGKVISELSVDPVQEELTALLDVSILKAPFTSLEEIKKMTEGLAPQEILMLENLRFFEEEERNDQNFARDLALLGEIFVQDAFSVLHREHASIVGIPQFLPTASGFLVEKEVKILREAKDNPKKPAIVIIGGAKTETKIPVIDNLLEGNFDRALIGGVVANNFLASQGIDMRHSKVDEDFFDDVREMLKKYNFILGSGYRVDDEIILPSDFVWNEKDQVFDIGPRTIYEYRDILKKAQTIIWNGPLGVFEEDKFAKGSREIARAIIKSEAQKIAGGGDTIAALNKFKFLDKFDFVSTGGGTMLRFLASEKLPGLEILEKGK